MPLAGPVLVGAALFALLGLGRHWLRGARLGRAVDVFWAAAALSPFVMLGAEHQTVPVVGGILAVAAAVILAWQAWPVSRGAALLVLPVAAGLALEAALPFLTA